jgi:hypothetical protein
MLVGCVAGCADAAFMPVLPTEITIVTHHTTAARSHHPRVAIWNSSLLSYAFLVGVLTDHVVKYNTCICLICATHLSYTMRQLGSPWCLYRLLAHCGRLTI